MFVPGQVNALQVVFGHGIDEAWNLKNTTSSSRPITTLHLMEIITLTVTMPIWHSCQLELCSIQTEVKDKLVTISGQLAETYGCHACSLDPDGLGTDLTHLTIRHLVNSELSERGHQGA